MKHYKTGENRKLSPRRGGPWVVLEKLPNGVNFKIKNDSTGETKVVHHDRLSPVKEDSIHPEIVHNNPDRYARDEDRSSSDDSDSDSTFRGNNEHSDFEEDSNDSVTDSDSDDAVVGSPRRYPQRIRRPRALPGTVPWSAINI